MMFEKQQCFFSHNQKKKKERKKSEWDSDTKIAKRYQLLNLILSKNTESNLN